MFLVCVLKQTASKHYIDFYCRMKILFQIVILFNLCLVRAPLFGLDYIIHCVYFSVTINISVYVQHLPINLSLLTSSLFPPVEFLDYPFSISAQNWENNIVPSLPFCCHQLLS